MSGPSALSAATPEPAVTALDLTILIPVVNEAANLAFLLSALQEIARILAIQAEIIVVDGGSTDDSVAAAERLGARALRQSVPGFGGAIIEGFRASHGEWVLTMDADLSHEPSFVLKLWRNRHRADILVASRYVRGGAAYTHSLRKFLSRVLNLAFSRGLSLAVRDMSSNFRLYRASVLTALEFQGRGFEILEEILVRAHANGWTIAEVPFTYFPRREGASHARVLRVGRDLARMFLRLWRLRNSIESADYDERAYYSWIPPQRWWHRRRRRVIVDLARHTRRVLDVGCGSSVILQTLNDATGVDVNFGKLRYMRRYGLPLVNASIFALPFAAASFDCVVCSEVIEHVPRDPTLFRELDRVLAPGGLLILGTPDYATWTWPVIERVYKWVMPAGYADEHISHYARAGLCALLGAMGYEILETKYVFRSELIVAARKGKAALDEQALRAFVGGHAGADRAPARND